MTALPFSRAIPNRKSVRVRQPSGGANRRRHLNCYATHRRDNLHNFFHTAFPLVLPKFLAQWRARGCTPQGMTGRKRSALAKLAAQYEEAAPRRSGLFTKRASIISRTAQMSTAYHPAAHARDLDRVF